MLKVFSYLNNLRKRCAFCVLYYLAANRFALKKKTKPKILPSDLPVVLVLKVAFLSAKSSVQFAHSHARWVPAGCKFSAYWSLGTKIPVWWNTFPWNLFRNPLKYLSANLCVWNLVLFIVGWSFKALCSSLLPTDSLLCVLPIPATTALKNLWGCKLELKFQAHFIQEHFCYDPPLPRHAHCVFRLC